MRFVFQNDRWFLKCFSFYYINLIKFTGATKIAETLIDEGAKVFP